MAGRNVRVAVVGASTLLGKELLDEMGASAPPTWDLQVLEEGSDAEGQLTSAGDEALVVQPLDRAAFAGLDLVFFAGTAELTQNYLDAALEAGAAVIDLTGSTAGKSGFLLRAPLLESGQRPDLTTQGMTLPHPATSMLALLEERLRRVGNVQQIAATVLEPASQAGAAGVDELHQQTVSLLSFQELPKAVFDAQVAFNLLGELGEGAAVQLASTRERIVEELRQLTGTTVPVAIQLLQAPVFHGYVVSSFVNLGAEATGDALRSALSGAGLLSEEDTAPSNQAATESGELLVRVRVDAAMGRGAWVLLAADNLRLTVRSAVAAAMELTALRPGTRVQ